MIVLDASALVEYLKWSPAGNLVADKLAAHAYEVHIPHLCTIETTSALRSLQLRSLITAHRARAAITDLQDFAATRHAHEPYLTRIWSLRENVSAYDAVYIALAEALDAPLLTCDAHLARAPLTTVTIEVVEPVAG